MNKQTNKHNKRKRRTTGTRGWVYVDRRQIRTLPPPTTPLHTHTHLTYCCKQLSLSLIIPTKCVIHFKRNIYSCYKITSLRYVLRTRTHTHTHTHARARARARCTSSSTVKENNYNCYLINSINVSIPYVCVRAHNYAHAHTHWVTDRWRWQLLVQTAKTWQCWQIKVTAAGSDS